MKIRVDIDSDLNETEIIIRAARYSKEVKQLTQNLQSLEEEEPLLVYKGMTKYYLKTETILFFETSARQLYVHTANDVYGIKARLYELEKTLPQKFLRVSKSAILNIDQIFALTHSVSSNLVQFQNSHKQIYVSRKYYKNLKERLEEREEER
ncbi:LytTR family DNA-binding domain-containing protein [Liquorilactobacillus capillatus]|uniref:Response regulator n=1 Tax=Liquorilactobacillus capillatus DSM 19910 TaxID=1423731 RepID=A0A0R1M614_9LACO|nr:LytTR family DNA-binding domain-containing protein [Liquorilactobacillus capillatus]KRL03552.1 response regulator [Liquorilactobacillus capillatus DSM 19910]